MSIFAKTKTTIWGTKNAWSLSPENKPNAPSQSCEIRLEIQGNKKQGFHLVMRPTGFFTADSWYASQSEALADANEWFELPADAWSTQA